MYKPDQTLESLKSRISELESENAYLRGLLEQAGISCTYDPATVEENSVYDPNQGARILPVEITHMHARRFFSYFWGRMDVFARRYQNKTTGKVGYFPQCNNFWRKGVCPRAAGEKIKCKECIHRDWTLLEARYIEAHLRGNRTDASDVLGVYPLFPNGTCRFLVFDFDNHEKDAELLDYANNEDAWKEEVEAVREICRLNQIPVLVERSRSGRGAHLWIFFDGEIEASLARRFGFSLLDKGAEAVNLRSFHFYDRMLPAQDSLEEGGLGNLIALPLQGQALRAGNSAFVDENWNAYPDQWNELYAIHRLSRQKIEEYIARWNPLPEPSDDSSGKILLDDDTKPWSRQKSFHKEDVDGELEIVLVNKIYIRAGNLKPRIQNQIRRLAAFSNPKFFKNNAIGLSNYANPRYIYLGEDDNGYICLPRGLMEALDEHCQAAGIKVWIDDKRSKGRPICVDFSGELRENQEKAVEALIQYDHGILSAATAFGKTVACSAVISRKKTSTLILLESSALIDQWERALNSFLDINEEPPEYQTKTGRRKKRKSVIGVIQGAKDTSTGIIDIAMAGSLCKKGEYHPRLKEYGMVLVDECHHSASDTIRSVLQEVAAKFVYGVTATPFRGDKLDKINYMLLGPVRFKYTAREKAAEQGIVQLVYPRFTRVVSPHGQDRMHVNDAYELIRNNDIRNAQITEDIKQCIADGRTPVVLTRYTEHAAVLYEKVKSYADKVFLLTGKLSKKEQHVLRSEMEGFQDNKSMVLIATGQLIGEGFDYPRLDTLILATPVAFEGIVEQYAGRLNRDYAGKEDVIIYDYVDSHIAVFDKMYAKRLKAYKRIGYQIYGGESIKKQSVNAIYDFETYAAVYERDLREALRDIVISSPTLSARKVYHMMKLLKERQEKGVKVTIVTWHPDVYMYGRDEHRINLMEMLRGAGFHIELAEETCDHYAIIDGEIVWYGSMNLLSKEDAEDNIMRVASRDIAAELLEMTFRKGNGLKEYRLPL